MRSLFRSNDVEIESSYIIRISGNETSETLARRCVSTLNEVKMTYRMWDAYDGTGSDQIVIPHGLKTCSFMQMVKVTDHYLTKAEVACALSHISLWVHCAKIDKPIVILEHDAVVVKKIQHFPGYNTILYLGGAEWAEMGWPIMNVPPHATDGPNKHFLCRAHAYAIDPVVAKNMLANTLKMGIYASADVMLSADLYNISHCGLIAYDKPADTTIANRPSQGHSRIERNDKLLF